MSSVPRFAALSPSRQTLVRLFQSIDCGYVQDLQIGNRDPVMDPVPLAFLDVKLDSELHQREELSRSDFLLCGELTRLFGLFDRLGDSKISRIEVRAGIPRRVIFEHRSAGLRGMSAEMIADMEIFACREAGRI